MSRWKLTDLIISVSNFHPEPCSICSFYNAHIESLKMFVETVDSLTFYSLLYCLYPGLRSGGERGGGSREQQSGGGNQGGESHLSGVFETIKYLESIRDSICVSSCLIFLF